MPHGPRTSSRPGAGPGRGKSRVRTTGRPTGSSALPAPTVEAGPSSTAGTSRRPSLTARAIALTVVLLILTISYASSLRIYFAQAHEISATKTEIAQRQQAITTLQGDLARWDDSAYVQTQARERLGWVVPGETGFKVVGADGKPLGGGSEIEAETTMPDQPQEAWWAKMWGSVQTADAPAPVKTAPKADKPITVDTKPKR